MEAAPKKVLVAEADEIVLVLITHVLTRQSYLVRRSMTAAETAALLATENYDVVVVASRLRDTGADFVPSLLAANPELEQKLIVLTNGHDDSASLGNLDVHAVLQKPVEIYNLLATVRDCVQRNQAS